MRQIMRNRLVSFAVLFLIPLALLVGSSAAIIALGYGKTMVPPGPMAIITPIVGAVLPVVIDWFSATATSPEPESKAETESKPEPTPEPIADEEIESIIPAPPQVGDAMPPKFDTPEVGITKEERESLLLIHNRERRVLDIEGLVWSDALAAGAQEWSDTSAKRGCVLAHSNTPDVGEVVYYSKKTGSEVMRRTPSEVMSEFLAEKKYYDEETGECDAGKICGHYTQIVWADTTTVGCGKSACTTGNEYEEVWTCQYAPAGNIEGELAY